MKKTPHIYIYIYIIQCMQHLKNSAKCNLNAIMFFIKSLERDQKGKSKELPEKAKFHYQNIHIDKSKYL